MTGEVEKMLLDIAMRCSYAIEKRGDLKPRMNDYDDFLELSVGSIEAMLEEAYRAGKEEND